MRLVSGDGRRAPKRNLAVTYSVGRPESREMHMVGVVSGPVDTWWSSDRGHVVLGGSLGEEAR
jgi:hypothetical protein